MSIYDLCCNELIIIHSYRFAGKSKFCLLDQTLTSGKIYLIRIFQNMSINICLSNIFYCIDPCVVYTLVVYWYFKKIE